jgi:transposase
MSQRRIKTHTSRKEKVIEGLPAVRCNVAGGDLGSESHWVCAPTADGSEREIADFGGTTGELMRMADWLQQRKVESIAIESTGVYWIPVHEVLEAAGLEVLLVNARQLKQVPGRDKKSDPQDCQWIQRLHSCGLLNGSYRPKEEICKLRTLSRDKANLLAEAGDWIRRIQKSLDQMNVRVHRAVSDVNGVTGMAIIKAIVAGERDPSKLAELRDPRCHRSQEEIAEELRGHWREDHLFSLQQSLKMYESIQERIGDYEKEMLRKLGEMERQQLQGQTAPDLKNPNKAKAIRKRGEEPKRHAFYRMSGVDLASIDAIGVETLEVVLSEYGPDLSRFPNEKCFAKHVTLAPHTPSSGGKPVKKQKRKGTSSRTAAALRMAVLSQRNSVTALGAYYRRITRRKGADVAVFATARKLAHLIYRLLRWGKPYVDEGAEAFEKRYHVKRIKTLQAQAREYGCELVVPATA